MHPTFDDKPRGDSAAAEFIAERIRHRSGLAVIGSGKLRTAALGHPAGSRYVRISAATSDDCDLAEQLLGPIARLSELAWKHGWELTGAAGTIDRFELPVFPTVIAG